MARMMYRANIPPAECVCGRRYYAIAIHPSKRKGRTIPACECGELLDTGLLRVVMIEG
jgi:hypothetical protein